VEDAVLHSLVNRWRTVARTVTYAFLLEKTDKKPELKLTKPPAYCTRASQSSTEDVEKLEKRLSISTSTM